MSRQLTVAALALAVAGGVYLSGTPAHASNMGFKLERNFRVERDPTTGTAFNNRYYLSFPLFNGLDPDLANTLDAAANKCVGDPAPSPAAGDGILNADDAICDLWTGRRGACPQCLFSFQTWVSTTCAYQARSANVSFTGAILFGGTYTAPLDREVGYEIIVGAQPPNTPDNRAVVVGSHDPSYAGQTIHVFCTPERYFLNVPYHTMYQTADEIFCGLETTDWTPDPVTQDPLTCPNGVYDTTAGRNYVITLQTFDNVLDNGGPTPSNRNSDNSFINRTVLINFTGARIFTGDDFNLIPGDAYDLRLPPFALSGTPAGHADTTWLSPHF